MKIKIHALFLALFFFLGACSPSLRITSLKEVPSIPEGKARVVHIFNNSPEMWRLFPIYVSVDKKPVSRIDVKRFSVIDVQPGSRMFSYFQEKAVGARDGIVLHFMDRQTRYLLVTPEKRNDIVNFHTEFYRLKVTEITPLEANRLLTN